MMSISWPLSAIELTDVNGIQVTQKQRLDIVDGGLGTVGFNVIHKWGANERKTTNSADPGSLEGFSGGAESQ